MEDLDKKREDVENAIRVVDECLKVNNIRVTTAVYALYNLISIAYKDVGMSYEKFYEDNQKMMSEFKGIWDK